MAFLTMNARQSRKQREQTTLEKMIEMYCAARHGTQLSLCAECESLLAYAAQRLEDCPFGEKKGRCAKCPVHCYTPERRQKIRQVMRYSGPRMLYKHPVFALRHLLDGLKHFPNKKRV